MLKRILIGLSALFLLLLGAVLILPGLVPTDSYRTRLESDLSRAFARDVTIAGDIHISTFPILKVETGVVSLSNPEGFPEGDFVDVKSMSAKVRLWPLLRKRVEISAVTLQSPSIRLEKQADGRVNWAGNSNKVEAVDTGPFKRDGRFTEYDPALTLLRIENGDLSYNDAVTDQDFTAKAINLDLRAPGLNQKISVNGEMILDDLVTQLAAELESPADFLRGLETKFAAEVSTADGAVDVTGKFLPSENIALAAEFSANSANPNALASRLPLPEDIEIPQLSSVSSKGQISFNSDKIAFPNIEFGITGDGINGSFAGNIDLTDGASSAGAFTANMGDMTILQPYLEEPIEALTLISSIISEGNIEWAGQNFSLTNIETVVNGPDLTANFTGNADYDSALSVNGDFSGTADGFAKLIETAGFAQADAAALNRVSASGKIALSEGIASLSGLDVKATEGFLNGQYNGDITYDDALGLNGQFSGEISDLGALDQVLPREIPYSNVVKQITLSSAIKSIPDGYAFSELSADLKDGLLNGGFKGRLTLGESGTISGNLEVSADSLRAIAGSQNITLPPSTDAGPILEAFSISGNVSGTPEKISFASGTISLDDITGLGNFTIDLVGSKPRLNGSVNLSQLDLRPYMAAWSEQNPEGKILPWSKDPIILSGLNAMDANIDMTTPAILMDRLELGQTNGVIGLQNGILTANLQDTQLYGGNASGLFSVRSENGSTRVGINAKIKAVTAQNFFMASGGFDKITGSSDLNLSFNGTGRTQDEIMKSLAGDGGFKIVRGQLLGLDAGALLSDVDTALTQRQLPTGIGLGKTTDFNDIDGTFSLNNGRASLNGFKLQSGSFFMEADGVIDIGQQSIDVGLRPKLTTGSDLAQFGIPLRFTGGFGKAQAGLDTNLLGDIAKARARAKAGDTVRDNLGGPLGNILGNVIGGQNPADSSQQEDTNQKSSSSEESSSDNAATPDETNPEAEASETPEEQIGNALKDLFGRKKKD